MNLPNLRLALLQMTSIDDVEINYQQIKDLIEEGIKKHGAFDLVCLPENALYMRLKEGQKIPGLSLSDEVFTRLSLLAQEMKLHIHVGASPLLIEGHLYNASVFITPFGDVRSTYKKMHLFDIQLQGQKPVRESDVFRHGSSPSIIEVNGWKIGESICYDLRFSELYAQYARAGVDAILVPSSFLVKTGQAHWEVLLRARAIESQAFVLAAAQSGTHQGVEGGLRETYGHSLIIDPWGQVLSVLSEGRGVVFAELSRSRVEEVRRQIPMQDHRRIPVAPFKS